LFSDFSETADGAPDGDGGGGGVNPGAAGDRLPATFAMPDADDLSLQCVLAAEGAGVGGVLRHFHLLHRLPERRAVTGRILAGNADFLGSLRHFILSFESLNYTRLRKS